MSLGHANAPWIARELAKLVVVGHVDHGKSTLIGRLLYDTESLPEGKFEELKATSERRGMPLEWSFVLDAFQAERDQAVTIDTTQIWFKTAKRDYVIIDAPGHKEFLKNMVTGAANADTALLTVDAREGVREQTRRHGYLLHIIGVKQVAVAVNKIDLVDYAEDRFNDVAREVTQYLHDIGVEPSFIVPVSARDGDNIARRSAYTPWYEGTTLLEALDSFRVTTLPVDQPLRFPVQDVYKFDERRLIAGRVESGILRAGDTLLFSPSNKTAIVRSIEAWNQSPQPVEARAGESVAITLEEQLFLERGEIASHAENPPRLTTVFKGRVFWFGNEPLTAGKTLEMKLTTNRARVTVQAIESVIDTDNLSHRPSDEVHRNEVAEVILGHPSVEDAAVLGVEDPEWGERVCALVVLCDGDEVDIEGYCSERLAGYKRPRTVVSVDEIPRTPSGTVEKDAARDIFG